MNDKRKQEMREIMADELRKNYPCTGGLISRNDSKDLLSGLILRAIDALAGKTTASNNEVEARKGHLKREQEHSAHVNTERAKKPSDLQRELDRLGDGCPRIRALAEKELAAE